MCFRGTHLVVLFFSLLVFGCGGLGSSGTGADERVGAPTQDLTLSVRLLQSAAREHALFSELPENQFASVTASLERDLETVASAEAAVPEGAQEVTLSLNTVPIGPYLLRVRGFNSEGQELAQSSATIEVFPAQVTTTTFTLVAGPVDRPDPVARDNTYFSTPGSTLSVNADQGVLSNDTTDGGTATVVTEPTQGTLQLAPDGSFSYTSNPDAVGFDTFVYQLNDPRGTDQATVRINFAAVGSGLFVQSGSTGTGESAEDPRPDLAGAVADSTPGDTIFILPSAQPLEPLGGPALLTLPDQVGVVGLTEQGEVPNPRFGDSISAQVGPALPEVRFQFQAGNNARFENLRLVAEAGAPALLDLSGKQSATLQNVELISPVEKIKIDDFTGTLEVQNCRFTGSTPEQNPFVNPDIVGDFVGVLNAGQTQVNVSDCDLDGVTFLIESRFTNNCVFDIRESTSSGNFFFEASEGGRLDLVLEDCEFLPLASMTNVITGIVRVIHRAGGQGDMTVRRISKEFSRTITFRSIEQTPGVGGSILVQCVEGGTVERFGTFDFDGGQYDLVVADNVVDAFRVINVSDLTVQVSGGAAVRALAQNNTFVFGLNSPIGHGDLDIAFLDNLVGTASSTDAPNPGGFTNEEIRRISVFRSSGALPEDRACVRLQGNQNGPTAALGELSLSVVSAVLPAELLAEDVANLENTNTVGSVRIGTGVVSVPPGTCDPPDYPGPCQ